MKKLAARIRNFFLPPADAKLWVRLMPFVFMGILTLAFMSGSLATWNYTNSTAFCGTTCHTMPPEYNAYLRSPHARVQCVECHLGRDTINNQIPRKFEHSYTLYSLIFKTYEYPIVAKKMRPANESCETCHFPTKFSDDSLREIRNYSFDEANTLVTSFLLMKTGGGTKRQGLGRGIHWHIENEVTFLAKDELQQEIPYVRVQDETGKVTEYFDIGSGLTSDQVEGQQLERMDCISCHNRVTHSIPHPEDAVGQALMKGLIPADLPNINKVGVDLLTVSYTDEPEAMQALEGLQTYYTQNYPQLAVARSEDIQTAIVSLKEIYTQIRFPEQKLDWTSHPNNIGHRDAPGCFRCHDGKHLSSEGEAIRLECNICHAIPAVADNTQFTTDLEVGRGPEPDSHTHTSWITLHGELIDPTCASCHPPIDPGTDLTQLQGKPPADGSFCGNSACHGADWNFTGFADPALKPFLDEQIAELRPVITPTPVVQVERITYTNTIMAILTDRCIACHKGSAGMAGVDLSTYQGTLKGTGDSPGVDPGNLESSKIYTLQKEGGHYAQLNPAELELLEVWISSGAQEE